MDGSPSATGSWAACRAHWDSLVRMGVLGARAGRDEHCSWPYGPAGHDSWPAGRAQWLDAGSLVTLTGNQAVPYVPALVTGQPLG